ncbi:MAG: Crp/Fnr family transcriptional regulator [Betaproteobacteria bacterium]|nr:Crp/Fnr family transcriptional regulator [Betaproteobacteria bacterium]
MTLEQEVELIRQIPIFSKIDPAMQKLLCFSSDRLTYEPGQVMFHVGDTADAAYVVIDGIAEMTVPTTAGEHIVVNTLGRNAVIGEIAIFGSVPRTATATAKTRLETLRIAKDMLVEVIRKNPDAAIEMIRILAERLANTTALLQREGSRTR